MGSLLFPSVRRLLVCAGAIIASAAPAVTVSAGCDDCDGHDWSWDAEPMMMDIHQQGYFYHEDSLADAGVDWGFSGACGDSDESADEWYYFYAWKDGTLRVRTCGTHDMGGEAVDSSSTWART